MSFVKAERTQVKLKIAITGPSGSGKTWSALEIAMGIGKRIALIDTENASASLYADRFEFDTMTIEPPYTIQKYTQAINAAEKAGYDVLIIDSISHAWAGEGGLLSKKEALDSRGGNSFSNWSSITKEQEQFKGTLLNANIHLICTMRSKQDYILETNDKGKQAPKKVGLAPIQRDGMEYEFTTVFDLSMKHEAQASKDRTSLFDGQIFVPTKKTGETFVKWLGGARAPKSMPADKPAGEVEVKTVHSEVVKQSNGAEYRFDFGQYKGSTIASIPAAKLASYIGYLKELKNPGPMIKRAISEIDSFYSDQAQSDDLDKALEAQP
jgi:hypothetical protein